MNMKRLGQTLKIGAEGQVAEAEGRLEAASEALWPIVKELIVSDFRFDRSYETAVKVFGAADVGFVAVDGSEDQKLLGGLAVFWAGSFAATGTIAYHPDREPSVEYDVGFVEKGRGLASCVPIYVDTIPEIDRQSLLERTQETSTVTRPLTQESVVDNSTIASWIMLLSELCLAYECAVSGEFKIILLDRSLSGTLSSLLYDTAKRPLWRRNCAISGFEIEGIPIDELDMAYARYHTRRAGESLPPRGDYLPYAILAVLERAPTELTPNEIANRLNLVSNDRIRRLQRFLNGLVKKGYVEESNGRYMLKPRYRKSWDRIRRLVELMSSRLFRSNLGNPLKLDREDQSRWMTTLDLAFLSLFTFNMLIEECLNRKLLLLGITKDTTARDFITHLIPVCSSRWKLEQKPAANTDRMVLQAISMYHHDEVPVPWATVEYDTAFQTIVRDFNGRDGYVSGAVSNRIILEKRFAKSYVQLDKAKSDDMFRSNVLFIDRLVISGSEGVPVMDLKHHYGGADEEIKPIFWESNSLHNAIQELVMVTLKAMGQQSLPEVFGHNKPLYIADKIAKAQRDRAGEIVKATGYWLLSNPRLRRFSFYMNTFRVRRSEVEVARRTT